MRRAVDRCVRPADSGSYTAFRVAFGLLVVAGQIRFLARGWVEEFYLGPERHLTYPGFEWVRPLPGPLMYALVGGLGVAGLMIAFGRRTRAAAAAFAIGFAYCELIDAGLYLNHYWFLTLAGSLLALLPTPTGRRVPAISVWALRAQLGVVYAFAGIAKLNADWLVRAEPLGTWLSVRTDRPVIGPILDEWAVAYVASWSGAAFDLTIVGWLLWRRSRPAAYAVLVVFHLATAMLFQIGMFPWVMIALSPIFFEPDWPSRARRRGRRLLGRDHRQRSRTRSESDARGTGTRLVGAVGRPTAVALVVLAAIEIVLPLRHLAAPGNVRWNDDGYLLSWRVMLTERATHVRYRVTDPSTGEMLVVRSTDVLDEWQAAAADVRADLILTTAHLVADEYRTSFGDDVEVRADVVVAWNARLRATWIDPSVDLAALDRSAPASAYVLDAPA